VNCYSHSEAEFLIAVMGIFLGEENVPNAFCSPLDCMKSRIVFKNEFVFLSLVGCLFQNGALAELKLEA